MCGNTSSQAYQLAGDLCLDWSLQEPVRDYHRQLDLDTATATVQFSAGGIFFKRDAFISAVDQVLAVRCLADRSSSLNLAMRLESLLRHTAHRTENALILRGQCPVRNEGEGNIVWEEKDHCGIACEIHVRPLVFGGEIRFQDARIIIENADEILLLATIRSNFEGYNLQPGSSGRDIAAESVAVLDRAAAKGKPASLSRRQFRPITIARFAFWPPAGSSTSRSRPASPRSSRERYWPD